MGDALARAPPLAVWLARAGPAIRSPSWPPREESQSHRQPPQQALPVLRAPPPCRRFGHPPLRGGLLSPRFRPPRPRQTERLVLRVLGGQAVAFSRSLPEKSHRLCTLLGRSQLRLESVRAVCSWVSRELLSCLGVDGHSIALPEEHIDAVVANLAH